MKVLVLNSGSSSLKFQLFDSGRLLAKGLVDSIGSAAAVRYEAEGRRPFRDTDEILEHKIAVIRALDLLTGPETGVLKDSSEIEAVGHRIVHGGERFKESVLIDDDVLSRIEECFDLAPLHNPPNVRGYRAARDLLPGVPHVAVFDTSFHQTMPPEAFLYGLPYVLYQRYGIRRYGFHGTSHRFVSARLSELVGHPSSRRGASSPEGNGAPPPLRMGSGLPPRPMGSGLSGARFITCHLGNGCSVTAVRAGRSVDTSMGFTPLEGLVMGTRSGDVDPAILPYVAVKEELGASELNALLNKHSGLLGISGITNDMRSLLEAEASGNERARLAIDAFCYRLKKYVAAYVGVLGGVDAVAFAGGIGENAPVIRARALAGLEALDLSLDPEKNDRARGVEAEISREGASSRVFVIPTNEELLIARDTERIVSARQHAIHRPR